MKKCPQCGCDRFLVTYHVTQTVMVDENEEYIATVSECDDITHKADNDDIWECDQCGYAACGYEFEINTNLDTTRAEITSK